MVERGCTLRGVVGGVDDAAVGKTRYPPVEWHRQLRRVEDVAGRLISGVDC